MKITAFCRDQNLVENRQAEMRKNCLALWNIPDKPRLADRTTPEEAARKCGFFDDGKFSLQSLFINFSILFISKFIFI